MILPPLSALLADPAIPLLEVRRNERPALRPVLGNQLRQVRFFLRHPRPLRSLEGRAAFATDILTPFGRRERRRRSRLPKGVRISVANAALPSRDRSGRGCRRKMRT